MLSSTIFKCSTEVLLTAARGVGADVQLLGHGAVGGEARPGNRLLVRQTAGIAPLCGRYANGSRIGQMTFAIAGCGPNPDPATNDCPCDRDSSTMPCLDNRCPPSFSSDWLTNSGVLWWLRTAVSQYAWIGCPSTLHGVLAAMRRYHGW